MAFEASKRIAPKLLLSLLLGGLLWWMVESGGIAAFPKREAFESVAFASIPVYILLLFLSHIFRATRWRFLIRPIQRVSLKDTILLNWIGFFAIWLLPMRLGEMARPALTKTRLGISISAGIGTVAVERVIDGLIASLCLAWALFALPRVPTTDPIADKLPYVGSLALVVFASAFVALFLFMWSPRVLRWLIEKTLGRISLVFADKLACKVEELATGLYVLRSPKLAAGFLGETTLYWVLNIASVWWLAQGCGFALSFGQAVALIGVLAIGILLPAGPGLFGNFHLALATGLRLYFPEAEVQQQADAYIFLLYTLQMVLLLSTGLIPFLAMKFEFGDLIGLRGIKEGMAADKTQDE